MNKIPKRIFPIVYAVNKDGFARAIICPDIPERWVKAPLVIMEAIIHLMDWLRKYGEEEHG